MINLPVEIHLTSRQYIATLKWRKDNDIDHILERPVSNLAVDTQQQLVTFPMKVNPTFFFLLQRPLDKEMKSVSSIAPPLVMTSPSLKSDVIHSFKLSVKFLGIRLVHITNDVG